jgi:hypothetical protein
LEETPGAGQVFNLSLMPCQPSRCRLQVQVALEDGSSFHIDQAATALGTG